MEAALFILYFSASFWALGTGGYLCAHALSGHMGVVKSSNWRKTVVGLEGGLTQTQPPVGHHPPALQNY
eukprot:5795451-Amphidinium_carterae.1